MIYTWTYLQKNPQQSKRLIGISYDHLMRLIELGKKIEKLHKEKLEKQKIRLISPGGGKKSKLSAESGIILTLIYLRQGVSFQVLGLLFQVSESTANNVFHYWLKNFREGLPSSLLEQVKLIEDGEKKLSELLKEYELIVDSTEQARPRPTDYEEQKKYYSGKKKNHTLKNQLIVLPSGADIVEVVAGQRGPSSDINIWRSSQQNFHPEQTFAGDKAYVGEAQIKTPHKKPKNSELTEEQKEENKKKSSARIFVEHLIRLVKFFRVAGERFRLSMNKYESVILTICGLVRLRIGALILEVIKSSDEPKEIEINQHHLWSQL